MVKHCAYECGDCVLLVLSNGKEFVINCNHSQYSLAMEKITHGEHLKSAFSFLSVDEQEVLATGKSIYDCNEIEYNCW